MGRFEIRIEMVKDLVCDMEVDENKAANMQYKDKTYYFCGPACQWAFKENPELFINKE